MGMLNMNEGHAEHGRWACSTWSMGMLNLAPMGMLNMNDGHAQHGRWAGLPWPLGRFGMVFGQVALANDEVRLQMQISVIEIGAFAALNMRLIEVYA